MWGSNKSRPGCAHENDLKNITSGTHCSCREIVLLCFGEQIHDHLVFLPFLALLLLHSEATKIDFSNKPALSFNWTILVKDWVMMVVVEYLQNVTTSS